MVPKWCPDVKNKVVKRKTAIITRYKKSLCLQGFSQITYKKICGNTGRFWLFHDPRNQVTGNRPWVRIPPAPPLTRLKRRFQAGFRMSGAIRNRRGSKLRGWFLVMSSILRGALRHKDFHGVILVTEDSIKLSVFFLQMACYHNQWPPFGVAVTSADWQW